MKISIAKRLLRAVIAVLLLLIAVLLVGPQRLAQQLQAANPGWFGAAMLCAIVSNIISAWRWAYIARGFGLAAPFAPLVSAYAQGLSLNLLPGFGSEALRSARLVRLGNPVAASVLTVVLDRASGLWILCSISFLATAGLAFRAVVVGNAIDQTALRAIIDVIGLQGLVLYATSLLIALAVPFLPWHMFAFEWSRIYLKLGAPLAELRALMQSRRSVLMRALLPSFGAQILSVGTLWLCFRALGEKLGYLDLTAIAAPISVAAALPFDLGGFGPREFVAGIAFPLLGLAPHVGVAAAALYGFTVAVQGVLAAPLLALAPGTKSVADPLIRAR
jgi:glycosyltransferase 2 family protein